MKVVIVGGYGVFGGLTARLLCRDGHTIWIAGRNEGKARQFADEIGAMPLRVDLHKEPEFIFGVEPDVVVDAAGPFQNYSENLYSLPRLCIDHGCHYLDLSDATNFTLGISEFDQRARDAGVVILSGASSVPGLSSVVVNSLIAGFDEVLSIDVAILPGNRAPRGVSVIEAILSGVGRPANVWCGGAFRQVRGWTSRREYILSSDLKRYGYFVDVPDIHLFPKRFGAKSVMFRAGLELGIMNRALSGLAVLRGWWDVDIPRPLIHLLHWFSRALYPFGTDRGGMQVIVMGHCNGEVVRRKWTLIAENGDGPFVPGILCRTILRHIEELAAGARPCLAEVSRPAVEAAMSDLAITTRTEETLPHAKPLLELAEV